MSATGNTDESQRQPRLGLLFALVNVPVLLLLGWLIVDWLLGGDSPVAWTAGRLVRLGGVVGVLASNCLLYRLFSRASGELVRSLRACSTQERSLRAVLDTAADGILSVDETGRISGANPAAARMFGYPAAELIGQPLSFVLPGALGSLGDEVGTGEQRVLGASRTIEARRKDRSRFPVSLGISKTRVAGRPLFTVIVHDLSEVQQARQSAQSASRAGSQFLVRMSHEVRTPLTGILGMTELLRDTPLTQEQRQRLDTIQQSAEAVLCTFAQVIDLAQLGSGELTLAQRGFAPAEMVRQAVAPLLPLARGKGLRLRVALDPHLPDRLRGDPLRLGQVLANLVGNAIKFTQQGEVVVSVELASGASGGREQASGGRKPPERVASELRMASGGLTFPESVSSERRATAQGAYAPRSPEVSLHFSVRDTGIGIPAEKLAGIFEPFEQADSSSTRRHDGLGLSLTVAARLVELMGGRIEAESKPGRGSTFRFQIALPEDSAMPAGPGAALVVLSSDEERSALEAHLSAWGYQAVGVATGRAALAELLRAAVEGNPFSLLLIAEHLPDLSAREVLRRLRSAHDAPLPAILLGHSEKDLPAPAGFVAVLSRPASAHELRQAVRQALARGRSQVSEHA